MKTTLVEDLLNNSRLSPTGNGNGDSRPFCEVPTNGQKWWAAIILGICSAVVNSSLLYQTSDFLTREYLGLATLRGTGNSLTGLILHSLFFTIIVRFLLW